MSSLFSFHLLHSHNHFPHQCFQIHPLCWHNCDRQIPRLTRLLALHISFLSSPAQHSRNPSLPPPPPRHHPPHICLWQRLKHKQQNWVSKYEQKNTENGFRHVEFIMSSMCPVSLWKTNSCKFMCILLINGYQASINYTRSPSLTSASPLWEAQKPVWGCRGQTADLCCSWSGLQEHQRAAWRQDETCVWDYSQTDGTVRGNSRTTLEDLLKDLQAAGTLPCSTHRYSCWRAHVHVKFVNEHMNDSDETNLSCLNGKERITASHWGKDRKS